MGCARVVVVALAAVASAFRGPVAVRAPAPRLRAAANDDAAAFNPMAALMDARGRALDGSAFDDEDPAFPGGDLGAFDPRVSPHAYDGGGARVGVLLVDHGSRVRAANDALDALRDAYARRAPPSWRVAAAHMEIAAPTIEDGVDALVDDGCGTVVCVPCFLSPGRHATEDVPRLFDAAAARHPAVRATMAPHLGTAPALVDAIHGLVAAAVPAAAADDDAAFDNSFFGDVAAAIAAAE